MRWFVAAMLVSGALAGGALLPVGCVGYLDADAGRADAALDAPATDDAPGPVPDGGADGPPSSGDGSTCGSPYACAVLKHSPLLYLRFNEPVGATKANDSSGGGPDGTYPLAGATLGREGALSDDPALEFAGDEGLRMQKGLDFDGPRESVVFSIELWIKPAAVDGYRFIIDHNTHEVARAGWDVLIADGTIELELYADDSPFSVAISKPNTIQVGKWHHVVFAYDGANRRTIIWIDKVVSYSNVHSSDATIKAIDAWMIGKQNCVSGCIESTFDGVIDELAVYPILLNQNIVDEHYELAGSR